jgi:hypothetical protein
MRKVTVVTLATAVALGVAPGIAGAAPDDDRVAGSARVTAFTPIGNFPTQTHVNAKGNAVEGRGQSWTRFPESPIPGDEFSGPVLCVEAVGNQAVILLRVDRSTNPILGVGSLVWRKVIDSGGGTNDLPDQTGFVPAFAPVCPPATVPFPTAPIDQGNFVVHDGG